MKSPLILTTLLLLACAAKSQNVGIGTTTPETILDVTSTTQGILIPRLNTLQMKSIPDPLSGLLITNTDSANRIFIYTGDGWQGLAYTTESMDTSLLVTKEGTQTVIGSKIFSKDLLVNGMTVGRGTGNVVTNTAMGSGALQLNTSGFSNTAFGNNTLRFNTTGRQHTAIGDSALYSNVSGVSNTAIGDRALRFNSTGNQNSAVGYSTLYSNTTGANNSVLGLQAMYLNTTGSSNTAVGLQSMYFNTSGNQNSAIGRGSLTNNTTGSNNVGFGFNSGRFLADGISNNALVNNSIFIGALARSIADNQINQIVIGYNALGDGTNTTVIGNTSVTSTKLYGRLRLPSYGTGANSGTPTYTLATDATGNIIEVAANSRSTPVVLTDGATITWDIETSLKINAELTLTGTGRTLVIDNPVAGEVYRIKLIQDGTGGRTIATWPTNTTWPGGVAPVLTVIPNSYDIITFYFDGTNFNGTAGLNFN